MVLQQNITLDPLKSSWDGEFLGIPRLSQVRATTGVLEDAELGASFRDLTGSSESSS
jgi:hypothetical protein